MPTDVEENSYSSDVQSRVVTYIRSLCSNIQIASEKGLGDSDDNFLSSPSHPMWVCIFAADDIDMLYLRCSSWQWDYT